MKHVEIRRHTDNDGDQLTEEGVAAAKQIGHAGLHPPYALFVSTGASRANQMVTTLRAAAGQEDVPVRVEPGLRSVVEDRWREASRASGGGDLEAMRTVDPELVDKETVVLGPRYAVSSPSCRGSARWWSATARPTRRRCLA